MKLPKIGSSIKLECLILIEKVKQVLLNVKGGGIDMQKLELTATTQYQDIIGELACDYIDLLFKIAEKGGIPSHYFPVALSIHAERLGFDRPFISIQIFACDKRTYGDSVDQINESAKRYDRIELKKFDIDIPIEDIIGLIKQLHIIAWSRYIN